MDLLVQTPIQEQDLEESPSKLEKDTSPPKLHQSVLELAEEATPTNDTKDSKEPQDTRTSLRASQTLNEKITAVQNQRSPSQETQANANLGGKIRWTVS